MDTATALQIADRAHKFIARVAEIATDEPEFAASKIADLYAEQGSQLEADAKAIASA